jgi:hypothetical protein
MLRSDFLLLQVVGEEAIIAGDKPRTSGAVADDPSDGRRVASIDRERERERDCTSGVGSDLAD